MVEVQQLNTGSQQWVGGSKADKHRELVEVKQLNKGEAGSTAEKYGESAVGWWKEVKQINTGSWWK